MDIQKRLRNPYIWIAVGAAFIAVTGLEPKDFISWNMVVDSVVEVVVNPFKLISFVFTVVGIFMNPLSKGITDNE